MAIPNGNIASYSFSEFVYKNTACVRRPLSCHESLKGMKRQCSCLQPILFFPSLFVELLSAHSNIVIFGDGGTA